MAGGMKRIAVVILIAVVATAVVALVLLSRPTRQGLTEEEVRQLVLSHPTRKFGKNVVGWPCEVKPETIEFLSLKLVPIEESPLAEDNISRWESLDKVWVVEYECYGRDVQYICGTCGAPPPSPFTRKFVRVVINAYTGHEIYFSAKDVE